MRRRAVGRTGHVHALLFRAVLDAGMDFVGLWGVSGVCAHGCMCATLPASICACLWRGDGVQLGGSCRWGVRVACGPGLPRPPGFPPIDIPQAEGLHALKRGRRTACRTASVDFPAAPIQGARQPARAPGMMFPSTFPQPGLASSTLSSSPHSLPTTSQTQQEPGIGACTREQPLDRDMSLSRKRLRPLPIEQQAGMSCSTVCSSGSATSVATGPSRHPRRAGCLHCISCCSASLTWQKAALIR